MGQVKITVLCENTAGKPLGMTGEHGFSAFVEKDGQQILFDTGQGMSLAQNAKVLGIDLAKVKTVVLSHGHYDHTGGLPAVLFPPRDVQIVAHPDIFTEKYAERDTSEGKKHTFIGMRYSRDYLVETFGARFILTNEFTEIASGMYFSGEVPRVTEFERPDTRLKVKEKNILKEDPLLDDVSLLIESDKGPVLLLGCAHAGVVNIMHHFSEKRGHKTYQAVIGGTHLGFMKQPDHQLERSMDAFDAYQVEHIAVSHCTGQQGAATCYNRFKDRFSFASAGWSMTF